jgi:hypothetical protein
MRPQGLVTVSRIVDGFGKEIPLADAVRYGWIKPQRGISRAKWGLAPDEVPLGRNLFLDQGRQLLAYAFGFRTPVENYVCRKYGVGTGTTAAKVSDVTLEAPITLASTAGITAPIDSVDYLSAFVIRVNFTLALGDANGYAISEMGLFSGNSTLLARKIRNVVVDKTSDFSPTLTWRLRL